MHFYWVWMDCSLLLSHSFFKDFFFFFFLLLIYFYQTFCCCCLVLSLLYFFLFIFFLSNIFSFLTGLSSLLGPLGFWHLALPAGVCSLECNNNNNNSQVKHRQIAMKTMESEDDRGLFSLIIHGSELPSKEGKLCSHCGREAGLTGESHDSRHIVRWSIGRLRWKPWKWGLSQKILPTGQDMPW